MPVQTRRGQFHITLHPAHGGTFTEWCISGSTPTAIPSWQLTRLVQAMSFWSGWPVELVLPAERATALWFSWWADALADIHPEHLHVEFVVCPAASKKHDDG